MRTPLRASGGVVRIAMAGASGTGKTTLMNFLAKEYGLPVNPVGSRSVSAAMGFASPYDVDKAGKRSEFQRRLVTEKRCTTSTASTKNCFWMS